MTMRLDIVTNDAGELVRLEHARDMGAATVQAVYRLAKLVQIHDMGNQAFLRQLEQTHQAIVEYGLRSGAHFNVLFASRAVFVGGQLLKGSRATYEAATELGEILEWCGGSDLTIQKDVAQKELQLFAEAIGVALRGQKGASYKAPSPKIRLRAVTDAARFRGLEIEQLAFEQKVVRTYASAVVIMRRFFADLQASRYVLPRRIKRVAQSLVDLSEGSTPAFLGVTDVRNQNFDDAGRAVNTAILAVSMARELTGDRVLLAQIAMAAMMHDVGRPRAAALGEGGPRMPGAVPKLSEDAEDKLAAGTAAVLTALGRVNEPTITRTVVAFESLWMRRDRFLGPLYGGARLPTVHSKIVQIARRYNDLVTPEPGLPEPEPSFAVATISQDMPDEFDRTVLRLLVATLNLLPVGTIVQLTSKEVAELIPSPDPDAGTTWGRVLRDARGAILESPIDTELGEGRRIVRVLSIEGWGKGLELISEGAASLASHDDAVAHDPEARQTLDLIGDGGFHVAPLEPMEGGESGPSSASVPSIASIRSLPEHARDYQPSSISNAEPENRAEGSYPSAGTSPSMVAEALSRAMQAGVQRPSTGFGSTRPVSFAEFEDAMIDVVSQLEEIEPTARGTLTSTPIVHVLVYMLDHRQTGSVVLREPDGRHHVIYFQDGCASVVRDGRPLGLLGAGLVAAGFITDEAILSAVDTARREEVLLGQHLVHHGLVPQEAVGAALFAQVPAKLGQLVNLAPDTDYAFYSGINLIADFAHGELFPCHPLAGILAAVKSWHDRARVRATLSRIARQPLTFHPQVDVSGLALAADEQAVVDAIHEKNATLSHIYDLRLADEETVSSVVYTFAVTRSFAFTAAKGGPMVPLPVIEELEEAFVEEPPIEEAPPVYEAPPVVLAPSAAPRAMPAISVAGAGVRLPSGAPGGAGDMATWRPAKVKASDVVDPAAIAPRPSRPADPPPSGREGGPPSAAFRESQVRKAPPKPAQPEDDNAEALVQAMSDFRMAETALARNDLNQAEMLAKKAHAVEPSNPDYGALVAWVSTLSGAKESIPLAIAKLSAILKEEALCERALLYRGRLYKRVKRNGEALRDFSSVLDINPKHAEAGTEARLLRMKRS